MKRLINRWLGRCGRLLKYCRVSLSKFASDLRCIFCGKHDIQRCASRPSRKARSTAGMYHLLCRCRRQTRFQPPLNVRFRRLRPPKRTIRNRPLLPKQEQIFRSGNHRRASQKATKKCPVRASKLATFDDLHRLKMDDLKQFIGGVR